MIDTDKFVKAAAYDGVGKKTIGYRKMSWPPEAASFFLSVGFAVVALDTAAFIWTPLEYDFHWQK